MRVLRRLGTALLWVVVALLLAIAIVPKFLDHVYYRGPVSGHFDGQRFFNPDGDDELALPGRQSRGGFLWRYLSGSDGRPDWPAHIAVTPAKPEAQVNGDRMVATWVGHATMLVQTQGLNVLTDPVWARTVGPFGIGPARVAEPGIGFDDLPKIDVVLISHNHYDHMDLNTLRRLWKRDRPTIVTSLGNDTVLKTAGVPSVTRDWGGRVALRPGIEIIVTRNHHWGSRWFSDRARSLWSSFVVTLPGGNLFFAGDTGMGDGLWPREAAAYGPVRLALIPIGAFRFVPGGMGIGSHIGPIDAAEVFDRLGASHGIGIHWGTFRLSSEAYDTPPRLLAEVMKCRGQTGFATVEIGKPTEIGPVTAHDPATEGYEACFRSPAIDALR